MFKHFILSLSLLVFLNSPAMAQEAGGGSGGWGVAPDLFTVFPIFLGGGLKVQTPSPFELGVAFGFTPEPYAEVIGDVAASLGDNSAYDGVIEAAFEDNSILRAHGRYHFSQPGQGWSVGPAVSFLSSKGEAEVDEVLAAATGKDYSSLKTALQNAGKSTAVDMDSELVILEIDVARSWTFTNGITLTASAGVGKVLSAEINLKTGLPAFEASTFGKNLLRSSESDLEDIVVENGISPTLGLHASYMF